jgi:N-acetylneuraminic acid mutarotase
VLSQETLTKIRTVQSRNLDGNVLMYQISKTVSMNKNTVFLLILVLSSLAATEISPIKVNPIVKPVFGSTDNDLVGDSWVRKAGMPQGGAVFGAAVVNGKIYAFGGYYYWTDNTNESDYATSGEYNSATDTWTVKAPMPTKRINFATAVYENKIYIIGGQKYQGWPALNTVEVYDPATNKWTNATPIPMPRAIMSANVVNGKIYVLGGSPIPTPNTTPDGGATNTTQVYDPHSNSWSTAASSTNPVYGYASAVIGDKIYVIGGANASPMPHGSVSDTNQIYYPTSDKWTLGAPLPKPVARAVAGSTTGVMAPKGIYVFGGHDENGNLISITQVYDIETNSWLNGTKISTDYFSAVAVLNDTMYIIGGVYERLIQDLPMTPVEDNPPPPFASSNYQYIPFGYETQSNPCFNTITFAVTNANEFRRPFLADSGGCGCCNLCVDSGFGS